MTEEEKREELEDARRHIYCAVGCLSVIEDKGAPAVGKLVDVLKDVNALLDRSGVSD
ncbi:hypothetical protein J7444_19650 [Labrenzia sp. R4_1]|uniref:hypothetical protein n=1 Tax=Stappiaceae TaxID=2821832 RepID=UPI001ADC0A41|nr:hypothetical protein [Labrenzia sp. R4_1]MBO9426959.1 hypothetical protein [Labrenzia sp. R4_1]